MSNKDINITNINILSLREQRNSLLQLLEMFDTDIINADSFDSAIPQDDESASDMLETTYKNIKGLINMTDDMLDIAEGHAILTDEHTGGDPFK